MGVNNVDSRTSSKSRFGCTWISWTLWKEGWNFSWLNCDWGWNVSVSVYFWVKKAVSTVTSYAFIIKKMFKVQFSERKIMASVFWDMKKMLLVDFMLKGTTINAAAYYETFKRLKKKLKTKGGECRLVVSHSFMTTPNLIPPGSLRTGLFHLDGILWLSILLPRRGTSDYHLFNKLKKFFGEQRFSNEEAVQKTVEKWFWEVERKVTTRVYKSWSPGFKNALISTAII